MIFGNFYGRRVARETVEPSHGKLDMSYRAGIVRPFATNRHKRPICRIMLLTTVRWNVLCFCHGGGHNKSVVVTVSIVCQQPHELKGVRFRFHVNHEKLTVMIRENKADHSGRTV
jgi:ribosomal protein S12